MSKLILRFDDISPGMSWSKFLPLKNIISSLGIRSILGVVPECTDPTLKVEPDNPNFFTLVREWASFGDTIAQHGTHHIYDSKKAGILGLHKRSEFAGHSYIIQRDRLAYGKDILENQGVWQPYFMAPSHSFDKNTIRALIDLDFIAITDGFGFHPYQVNGILLIPQLTARPLNINIGIQTICIHINGMNDSSIEVLENFIIRNKTRFIDFKDIFQLPKYDDRFSSFLRFSSSLGVKSARNLRFLKNYIFSINKNYL